MCLQLGVDHELSSRCYMGWYCICVDVKAQPMDAHLQCTAFYHIHKIKILIVLWNLCTTGIIVVGGKKDQKLNIYPNLS